MKLTNDFPAIHDDLEGEKAEALKKANFLYELDYEFFANEALRKIFTQRAVEDGSVVDVRVFTASPKTDDAVEWWDNYALTQEQREDILRMLEWTE